MEAIQRLLGRDNQVEREARKVDDYKKNYLETAGWMTTNSMLCRRFSLNADRDGFGGNAFVLYFAIRLAEQALAENGIKANAYIQDAKEALQTEFGAIEKGHPQSPVYLKEVGLLVDAFVGLAEQKNLKPDRHGKFKYVHVWPEELVSLDEASRRGETGLTWYTRINYARHLDSETAQA